MKVLFFAQAREITGCDDYVLTTGRPVTQQEFWTLLQKTFPQISSHHKTARLARNETYLQPDELLHPNDEIAIIPPVSGG